MEQSHSRIKSKWSENDYRSATCMLGYDPNKIIFVTDSYLRSDENQEMLPIKFSPGDIPHMVTDCVTGEIMVVLDNVPDAWEMGDLAHEIFHVAFAETLRAVLKEVESGHPGELMGRFADTLGSPWKLSDVGYVTNYAHTYVSLFLEGKVTLPNMATEVLSEMARVHQQTGHLPNTPIWRQLYKDVEKTAIELGVLKR